ncbi:MAG: hypothetical protein JO270_24920 [Acidobacteriaceae bacterium]|nr:hypothetical protein [Acidobacteriaceae bacterium]
MQNFSLLGTQQQHGYASVLAGQLGATLNLPLVPYPGIPPVLELNPDPPPPVIPVSTTGPAEPRVDPTLQANNISVPGFNLDNALNLVPSVGPNASPVQEWAYVVLALPGLPNNATPTQLQTAQALKPTTVVEWLGSNDALVPALLGQLNALTPIDRFAADYESLLASLQKTGATLIVANVPDVTEVPYFTPVETLAHQAGLRVDYVANKLGVGTADYLRLSAIPVAEAILKGAPSAPSSLPQACASPTSSLSSQPVPCVLTAADANTLRVSIGCYNLIIELEAALHGALVVDIHSLVDRIYTKGYTLPNGTNLTPTYLGGLFSFDGIHPTDTGYGIIANAFIDAINQRFHTHYADADVSAIFEQDSLRLDIVPYTGPLPASPAKPALAKACLAGLLSPLATALSSSLH